jgi:hypothetical protein
MAKIVEEVLVVKFSKIVKDDSEDKTSIISDDILAALEQVSQELVTNSVIVEVVKA